MLHDEKSAGKYTPKLIPASVGKDCLDKKQKMCDQRD